MHALPIASSCIQKWSHTCMWIKNQTYISYLEDTHQRRRSAKFLWKSKFCSGSGFGSGSWFYFGFQYQIYISYIEDTHQIFFWIRWLVRKLLCPREKSTYVRTVRQTDRQIDRQTEIFFCLVFSSKTYKSWTFIKRSEFFFHSCDYNTFYFYILRMWWESKKEEKSLLIAADARILLSWCNNVIKKFRTPSGQR